MRAWTRTRLISLVGTMCGIALVACGGSGATAYHNPKYPYGAPNVPISLSKCMRGNGVPDFPDPREGPDGGGVGFPGGLVIESSGQMVVMGQPIGGPALVHAERTCKEYLPPGGPGPTIPESQRVAALAHAACMREHGLRNFPDPTFNGGRQGLDLGSGLNPDSPAVQRAAHACGLLAR